eukprot:1196047-Prorocentrum_minimum.AAC.2
MLDEMTHTRTRCFETHSQSLGAAFPHSCRASRIALRLPAIDRFTSALESNVYHLYHVASSDATLYIT